MTRELVLYTNPQSRGGIAHWMLEEVGQPFRTVRVDFAAKTPEFLALNPMGKVPVLTHGDTVVTEAAAICAYLADAFPEAGLAPAPVDRADYYRWLFFTANCLEPAVVNRAFGLEPPPERRGAVGYGSYDLVMDTLADALRGKTCIAGDRFSAADLYLAAHLGWGMQFGTIDKRPEFEAYCGAHWDRPAAIRAQKQAEELAAG